MWGSLKYWGSWKYGGKFEKYPCGIFYEEHRGLFRMSLKTTLSVIASYMPTDVASYMPTDVASYMPTDVASYMPTDVASYMPKEKFLNIF